MRLLESEEYRGKQIRVYVIYPHEAEAAPHQMFPTLGVRIDGEVVDNLPVLSGIYQLADAMAWARRAIDRLRRSESPNSFSLS